MDDRALWKLNTDAWKILESRYWPSVQGIIEESGLEGRGWGLLVAALTFEPDPTTPAHLMVRNPYTSADLYLARLRVCSGKGYLKESTAGEFRLTPKGRKKVEEFIRIARSTMENLDPLPPEDAVDLARTYKKLVTTCLQTPPPPQSWSINLSYKLMPPETPPLPFIEQAMSCLSAYRDDAHLAAWQGAGMSATALELMTILWRIEADTLKGILQKLAFRGYADQVYEDALDELHDLGYIQRSKGSIILSQSGDAFRNNIEMDTDRYFFSPWRCLGQTDKQVMKENLSSLIEELRISEGKTD